MGIWDLFKVDKEPEEAFEDVSKIYEPPKYSLSTNTDVILWRTIDNHIVNGVIRYFATRGAYDKNIERYCINVSNQDTWLYPDSKDYYIKFTGDSTKFDAKIQLTYQGEKSNNSNNSNNSNVVLERNAKIEVQELTDSEIQNLPHEAARYLLHGDVAASIGRILDNL